MTGATKRALVAAGRGAADLRGVAPLPWQVVAYGQDTASQRLRGHTVIGIVS